jgi:hypothetical protein
LWPELFQWYECNVLKRVKSANKICDLQIQNFAETGQSAACRQASVTGKDQYEERTIWEMMILSIYIYMSIKSACMA